MTNVSGIVHKQKKIANKTDNHIDQNQNSDTLMV